MLKLFPAMLTRMAAKRVKFLATLPRGPRLQSKPVVLRRLQGGLAM